MFKDLLQFAGAQTLSMTAMLFFLAFFLGILLWVVMMKKDHAASMSKLPLDGNEQGAGRMRDEG
jgi:hypothetical protein